MKMIRFEGESSGKFVLNPVNLETLKKVVLRRKIYTIEAKTFASFSLNTQVMQRFLHLYLQALSSRSDFKAIPTMSDHNSLKTFIYRPLNLDEGTQPR